MSLKFNESLTTKSGCLTFCLISLTLIGAHLDVDPDAAIDCQLWILRIFDGNLSGGIQCFTSTPFILVVSFDHCVTELLCFHLQSPGRTLRHFAFLQLRSTCCQVDVSQVEKFNSHRPCQLVNSLRRPFRPFRVNGQASGERRVPVNSWARPVKLKIRLNSICRLHIRSTEFAACA